jgi:hypothetical protein
LAFRNRAVAKSNFHLGSAKLPLCGDDWQVVATLSEIHFGNHFSFAAMHA